MAACASLTQDAPNCENQQRAGREQPPCTVNFALARSVCFIIANMNAVSLLDGFAVVVDYADGSKQDFSVADLNRRR